MKTSARQPIIGRLSRRDVLRVGSVSLSTGLLPALGIQAAPTVDRDHRGRGAGGGAADRDPFELGGGIGKNSDGKGEVPCE